MAEDAAVEILCMLPAARPAAVVVVVLRMFIAVDEVVAALVKDCVIVPPALVASALTFRRPSVFGVSFRLVAVLPSFVSALEAFLVSFCTFISDFLASPPARFIAVPAVLAEFCMVLNVSMA